MSSKHHIPTRERRDVKARIELWAEGHDRPRRDFHRTAHLCRGRFVTKDTTVAAMGADAKCFNFVASRIAFDTPACVLMLIRFVFMSVRTVSVVTSDNILMAYVMGIHVFRGSCHGHVTGDDEKMRVPMFRNLPPFGQDSI